MQNNSQTGFGLFYCMFRRTDKIATEFIKKIQIIQQLLQMYIIKISPLKTKHSYKYFYLYASI